MSSSLRIFTKRKLHCAFVFTQPFLLLIFVCIWLVVFYQNNLIVVSIQDNYAQEYVKPGMACKLPKLDPFNTTIQKYLYNPGFINCSFNQKYPQLFSTDLRSTLIQLDNPYKYGFNGCCYNSFVRKNEVKNKIILNDECEPITEIETRIPETDQFIEISCAKSRGNLNDSKEIVGIFNFLHAKPSSVDNVSKANNFPFDSTRKNVNVVMFGIDSLSHMNFIRTFPQSYEYLTQNLSAFGLWGYTKVGKNTFPNMVPVLTGLSEDELEQTCWKNRTGFFDDCPFIWKNYSNLGYLTSYAEDDAIISMFNYQKKGFKAKPVDYFFETMTHEQDTKIGHPGRKFGRNACYGSKLSFQFLLDFLKQMAIFSSDEKKNYFQYVWSTALTHEYLTDGTIADAFLVETLEWFKNEGYLENTVIILTSDHGINWGRILTTDQGKIENRMPFLYFLFPDWFQRKYSTAVGNLNKNKNKLTTAFDLHETLADLLLLQNIENEKLEERHLNLTKTYQEKSSGVKENNFSRGISLFLSIPLERTCKDAAIPDPFCVCRMRREINIENNTFVKEGAKQVVQFINGILSSVPQCKELYLEEILGAQLVLMENEEFESILEENNDVFHPSILQLRSIMLNLSVKTKPSNATFDAIVTRSTDGKWIVDKEISRTNLYGKQSSCVNDSILKNYCLCSDTPSTSTSSIKSK